METSELFSGPFDLFANECSDVDIEIRINAIKKLKTVALALDTEKTKTELFPYLDTLVEGIYNDDEVLVNLAEVLGDFLPYVGGNENAHLILHVLEKLAAVEETVVREKAIQSLNKIATSLDSNTLEAVFVPMIFRLTESVWFTSKSSATALFSPCYQRLSPDIQTDLRNIYRVLCQEESPLVRRSSATMLAQFVKVLDIEHLKNEFIPVFDNLSKDDQDSVRVLAVDVGISLALRLKKKEVEDFILTTLTELSGDASWRVRYQMANQISAIQKALGYELTKKYLVAIFQNLVHDTEPQVREASARAIVLFCKVVQEGFRKADHGLNDALDPTITEQIFPLIQYLNQDLNPEVKEALSKVITSLSPLLGVEHSKNFLLPLITSSLLNDSSRVQENIISNLNSIISVIGIADIADTVLKIIIDLVNSSASVWRTRRNLIVTINYIANYSGKEYFDNHLKVLYQKLLSDGVYAVRKTAPLILPILVKNFGFTWALKSVIPLFIIFSEHKHYLYRYVCLFCMDELISPTLEANFLKSNKYLQELQGVPQSNDILRRIATLNKKLKRKLSEVWVKESLTSLQENEVSEDNINKYAEETIEIFVKDNNINITSISKSELEGEIYLEGVLDLFACNCMIVLKSLSKDSVPNIQNKTARTLKKLAELNKKLEKELQEEWASEIIGNVEEEAETPTESEENLLKVEIDVKSTAITGNNEVTSMNVNENNETETIKDKDSSSKEVNSSTTSEEVLKQESQQTLKTEDKSMEAELIEILQEKLSAEKTADS